MYIDEKLLQAAMAAEEHYGAGDYIFREGAVPQFYYQINNGEIKLNSYREDGKEFIHSILGPNESFGHSMLILGRPYPVNAVAVSPCTIIKVSREHFFILLQENPSVFSDLYATLSENTIEKMVLMNKITSENAEDLLSELLNRMKATEELTENFSFEVPHTRQQLAALTGLSVETVIRAIKRLEKNGVVAIRNRKIYC